MEYQRQKDGSQDLSRCPRYQFRTTKICNAVFTLSSPKGLTAESMDIRRKRGISGNRTDVLYRVQALNWRVPDKRYLEAWV